MSLDMTHLHLFWYSRLGLLILTAMLFSFESKEAMDWKRSARPRFSRQSHLRWSLLCLTRRIPHPSPRPSPPRLFSFESKEAMDALKRVRWV